MRRTAFVAVSACAFVALATAFAPQRTAGPATPEAALPAVSSDAIAADIAPPPAARAAELDVDPGAAASLAYLRSRHTGLSEQDVVRVANLIAREAKRHDLEPDLVLAVISVESGGYNFARSGVGALGLMQLMPATGQELAHKAGIPWAGPETLFSPDVNIRLGVAYLKKLADRYGSVKTALAAYNWGPGRIDRKLRRGARVPTRYIDEVLKAYTAATGFEEFPLRS